MMTPEQIANKWIKELADAGYTYDQMLEVFKMAREKLKCLKNENRLSKN